MIIRQANEEAILLLSHFPVLGLVGPRQVGKTTLAKSLINSIHTQTIYLDLESPSDFNKLANAETFFDLNTDKCIVIDEIQRSKELFPIIRSSVDKNRKPARFILLGSASPELIRDSSESLAGRIAYLEIAGLNIKETSADSVLDLFVKGGFPEPFLHSRMAKRWYSNFTRTYIERDLPMLGFPGSQAITQKLWSMLAHYHGQILNYSELAKSLELNHKTVKTYIDFLESAYLIRLLQPFHFNTKKRLVKAPKLYLRDTGILHHFLGIRSLNELLGHPKLGASWEGFVIEQIKQQLSIDQQLYYYRTHGGAELDLIITEHSAPIIGIEIKFGDQLKISRGNHQAISDLNIENKYVVKYNEDNWQMDNGFIVNGLLNFIKKLEPFK